MAESAGAELAKNAPAVASFAILDVEHVSIVEHHASFSTNAYEGCEFAVRKSALRMFNRSAAPH
jgi:hypothetical protein